MNIAPKFTKIKCRLYYLILSSITFNIEILYSYKLFKKLHKFFLFVSLLKGESEIVSKENNKASKDYLKIFNESK